LRTVLEASGGEGVSVEEAEPTLEDVFLAVVGRGAEAQSAHPAKATQLEQEVAP
jgi:hypothetical protein